MFLEQCTFLPDMAGDCSQTSFLDIGQLPLLSGMDMPAKSCENDPQTDGFLACECMKGTLACSTHPSTPEAWTAFMRDSLAKTLASLESRQAYLREPDQVFTAKSCASLAWYDPSSSSWRTYQQSFLTDSEPFSETWPRWGMTAGGSAYAHPMSERRITEIDGSYLPTPTVTTGAQVAWDKTYGQTGGTSLAGWVKAFPAPISADGFLILNELKDSDAQNVSKPKYWPTPTAHNAKETNSPSEALRNTPTLAAQVGGSLNPTWVEWLMGFPIGFTVSKDWVTRSVHSKRQQRSASSVGKKEGSDVRE